jgi:DNA-binding IclR family transcriptional regulator
MTETQTTRLRSALVAVALLRREPLRSIELAERLGQQPRTTKRLLVTLREVGAWCRAHGLDWWEVTTEVRGRERWHRLVDRPAEMKTKKGRQS